jgi:plasmid stabilization system protein ParE
MKYDLVIKEEAIVDMQQAYDYYEERKTGLGERFLNTLEEYLGRVRKNPLHYQIKRKPYREVFIKHFPYLIIYEILDSRIIVYAIFNTSLNPKKKPK